jgi:hypothetical protein
MHERKEEMKFRLGDFTAMNIKIMVLTPYGTGPFRGTCCHQYVSFPFTALQGAITPHHYLKK